MTTVMLKLTKAKLHLEKLIEINAGIKEPKEEDVLSFKTAKAMLELEIKYLEDQLFDN